MITDLQQLITSPYGVGLVSTIGHWLPPRLGYFIADGIAGRIARQQEIDIVRAVRANQWVVLGEAVGKDAVDRAVHETFRNSARSIYDLYHHISRPEAAGRLIVLDSTTRELARRPEFDGRGLMIVGLHLSNFDLVLQWMCTQGMRILGLTIPDPQGGRRLEFEMRKRTGIELLPTSVGAIRHALRRLQKGGMVVTGIDRPVPDPQLRPSFFGRSASLPIHHVYLAKKAQVPLVVIVVHQQPDGKYHVMTSEPIEMESHPDREIEALQNAEKVLNIAERYIRRAPHQWSITLPVWPETLDLVPR